MSVIQKMIFLVVAGSIGTLARYGLAGVVHKFCGTSFPWGTLVVNVTGCFLAGLLWTLFESRWQVSGETRIIIMVGFMGAFTTFSAYMLETSELVRAAEWMYASMNVILQNGIGFAAFYVGTVIARLK